jgi:anti-sigma regulatory factor (Ser/Thr protein kinase)
MPNPAHTHETEAGFTHEALFYRDADEYLDGVLRFITPGLQAGEPVAMALPPRNAKLLRERLDRLSADIEILDMVELGRNPGRIIPAVQTMLEHQGGKLLHYVGEPIWPGRSPEEIREATKHEALINLAWSDAPIRVICPYDAVRLDARVLADAERTHPQVVHRGKAALSRVYSGPAVPSECEQPLPDPPEGAAALRFGVEDLAQVRALIGRHAASAGLRGTRAADLVVAVNELATNTITHAGSPGLLRVWSLPGRIVCQVEDPGHIDDPLAGRRPPQPEAACGRGLWIVNQVCDLVEVRTGSSGTNVRVHARA